MVITFGSKFMGKVDEVGADLWVETRFHHVLFAPLIPVASWIVVRQGGGGGVPQLEIPVSSKSVAVAWMWYIGLVAGIGGLLGGSGMFLQNEANWQLWIEAGCVGVMLLAISNPWSDFRKASYERACELARALKLNDGAMAQIAEMYGKPAPNPASSVGPPR